jgi:putative membrane protein
MNQTSGLSFVLHWLVSGLAVLVTSRLVSGFAIEGFVSACIAALAIGLANAVLWPLAIVLTLPINLLTLGLFTFVVNGAILKICASLLPGFTVETWGAAILGSIVLSIVGMVFHLILV